MAWAEDIVTEVRSKCRVNEITLVWAVNEVTHAHAGKNEMTQAEDDVNEMRQAKSGISEMTTDRYLCKWNDTSRRLR